MAAITISGFMGMMPSANPKLIPDNASTFCQNTFSRFGDLRPVATDSTVTGLTAVNNAKTLYRFSQGARPWVTHAEYLNFVRGPVARDITERTYYSGDGAPKATNLTLVAAGTPRDLGLAYPTVAPTVAVTTVNKITYTSISTAVTKAFSDNITFDEDARYIPTAAGYWGALTADDRGEGGMVYKIYRPGQTLSTFNRDVTYVSDAGRFVMVGDGGALYTSNDAIGWTTRVSSTSVQLNAVIAAAQAASYTGTRVASRAIAVGKGAIIYGDGDSKWDTASVLPGKKYEFYGVAWSEKTDTNHDYVAVGHGGAFAYSIDEQGAAWTTSVTATAAHWRGITRVKYNVGGAAVYLAVAEGGYVGVGTRTSSGWTITRPVTTNLHSVAADKLSPTNTIIAVGAGGVILKSTNDGTSWTAKTSGTTQNLLSVKFDNTQFVVAGEDGVILTSPDGESWTARTSGVSAHITSTGGNSTTKVYCGPAGTIYRSADAYVTWVSSNSNIDTSFLLDARIGGKLISPVGVGGTEVIELTIMASPKAPTIIVEDSTDIYDAIQAIHDVEDNPVLTTEVTNELITKIKESTVTATYTKELDTFVAEWLYFVDRGINASTSSTAITTFYAQADVKAVIDNRRNEIMAIMGQMASKYTGAYKAGTTTPLTTTAVSYDSADTTTLRASFIAKESVGSNGAPTIDAAGAKDVLKDWLLTKQQPYSTTLIAILDGTKKIAIPMAWVHEKVGKFKTYYDAVEYLIDEYAKLLALDNWKKNIGYPAPITKASLITSVAQLMDQIKATKEKIEKVEITAATDAEIEYVTDPILQRELADKYLVDNAPVDATYTYVITWVSDWGEESAPSPASTLVTTDSDDIRTVTLTGTAPANAVGWRLYRSNSGQQSSLFQLVTTTKTTAVNSETGKQEDVYTDVMSVDGYIPLATTSVADTAGAEYLGEECPSFGWLPPPSDLKNLTGMPNGILAGHTGRTIHFCEPWKPYAWPTDYDKPLPTNIVGLGAFGQTLFVGTESKPYVVSGADSAAMSEQILDFDQACLSGRSIVSFGTGIAYAGSDGLCLLGNGVPPTVVSQTALSIGDWRALGPSTMFGAFHDNRIHMFHSTGCMVWDLLANQMFTLDIVAKSAYVDNATDTLYYVNGTTVYALFGGSGSRTASWYSKTMHNTQPVGFSWISIDGDISSSVVIRVYADNVLIHTATFTDTKPQRLPAVRAMDWKVQIESASTVVFVSMASSTEELKAVP